ncbi:MAG: DUF342 domain-containing protein [Proteobacteria bacterium]|nr:DUF342 domain-containing protein [Pseudomonadota bacterium]
MAEMDDYGILVVDDDESTVKSMRRVLKRKGFSKIISALSGEQGIKLLESAQDKFFLIISDYRMPGMGGSEFLERSILLSPESRRMLITGLSKLEAIVEAINKGAIHQYIPKPWNNDDLLLTIVNELEHYKQFQERKRLFNVTKKQNAKLFELAAGQKKNDEAFQDNIAKKKEEADLLRQEVEKAKHEAEFKEAFLGLDELLSRTITINKNNLAAAFAMSKNEIVSMMKTISQNNKVPFQSDQTGSHHDAAELDDETFEIIDLIIENVVQAVESDICGIGSEPSTGVVIDDYKEIPDFGTLAFNDGYITKGELEKAGEELAEKEAEQPTGLTIDKVMISKGFIERKDLSRIFAKLALIETRLLDREFANHLIKREIATKKDVDRAFRKQLNNFEDSGVTVLLGDLLIESDVIAPELRDEVMAELGRTGDKKSRVDQSSAFSSEFGAAVDLVVSDNKLEAFVRVPVNLHGTTDIEPVKKLIKKRGIKFGIVDDAAIRKFIEHCKDPVEQFIVAKGVPARVGKPAEIVYHFNTTHETGGVIAEDGSIDFHSTGDSPFVKKGDLVAEKKPMENPKPGKDIFGETLPVGGVEDAALLFGDGVALSEDGFKLFATIQGQPVVDLKGTVSVLEQFTVKGDVDFRTGNIDYKGNVIVYGAVKHGFTVKCEELTVNEIDGGIIRITGNLNVSNGIINSDVETQGSVQCRFVNNSKIYGYRNMMVTREIMESHIAISGEFNNETGRITSSVVAARKGLSVKQIGTEKATYSTVKAGSDDHIRWVTETYDIQMERIQSELDQAIREKMTYDEENNRLHVEVANQTFAQEKITKKIDFTEKKIGEAKDNKEEKLKLVNELKELEKNLTLADERIKGIFEEQDKFLNKIDACDEKIKECNTNLSEIKKEKETLVELLTKEDPVPVLKVNKKIFSGTRIEGTMASLIVDTDLGMSKFSEIDTNDPDNPKQIVLQNV